MADIEVDAAAIEAAAASLEVVAEQVRSVRAGEDVVQVAAALAGASSAEAARSLGSAWEGRFADLLDALVEHAAALRAAGSDYAAQETATAARLDALASRTPSPAGPPW